MNLRAALLSLVHKVRPTLRRACRPHWPRLSRTVTPADRDAPPLPAVLAARLESLRRRHLRAALVGGFAMAFSLVCAFLVFQGLTDWWFGLAWWVRAVLQVLDLGALTWVYGCFLHHPFRVRLGPVDLARLVERRWPQLGQGLLTAAELAEGGGLTTSSSPQLAAYILAEAEKRTATLDLRRVVPLQRTGFAVLGAGLALALTLGLALLGGEATLALLKRIALFNTARPTKTAVVPITRNFFAAAGDDVKLSARAARLPPSHGRVELSLPDDAARNYALSAEERGPRVFEATVPAVQKSFHYRFLLGDGRGDEFAVTVKNPPAVTALSCEVVFPAYTRLPPKALDLAAPTILAGSRLVVRATASSELRSATLMFRGMAGSIEATLNPARTAIEATLPIPAKDLNGWSLQLVDTDGVTSRLDTVHPLEIVPDHPPEVEWVWPRVRRMLITLRAKPELVARAKDDFGLSQLALKYRPIPQIPIKSAWPLALGQTAPFTLQPAPRDDHFRQTLDLSTPWFGWEVGRIIEYWAEAVDNNDVTGPGLSTTPVQQLQIVSPQHKSAELFFRRYRSAGEIDDLAERHAQLTAETEETLLRETPPLLPPKPVP